MNLEERRKAGDAGSLKSVSAKREYRTFHQENGNRKGSSEGDSTMEEPNETKKKMLEGRILEKLNRLGKVGCLQVRGKSQSASRSGREEEEKSRRVGVNKDSVLCKKAYSKKKRKLYV